MSGTFSLKEKCLLGILFLAAVFSLIFFLQYRTIAFPEHTINFSITRDQAASKAQQFMKDFQLPLDQYQAVTIFNIDNAAKTYLERELGASETERLTEQGVDLWRFKTRFFKSLQKEEFSVSFLPNGRFIGYSRQMEENAKGVQLSSEQAQVVAQKFLDDKTPIDISEWKLVSADTIKRPHRVDHLIVWEKEGFRAKDATYRLQIGILGDQVGEYKEFLKIPETWTRQYQQETSHNELAQSVANFLAFCFFVLSVLITFILEFRRSNLRLGFAWWIGGITGIIQLLSALNQLPLALNQYPTIISWEAFIGYIIFLNILGALVYATLVTLIVASGEAIYRAVFPEKLALEKIFKEGIFTKQVPKELLMGVFVGIIAFAYEVIYYFLGKNFGFWSPAEINYSDVFSTALPWVYPLTIGFIASVTEEGLFRLFGISFLKKYLKNNWLPVLITAITWAFLHSNYPQSPWFVRGIELTIMGIVFGFLYLRYGIIVVLTAHYTFNALQVAILTYSSGNLYTIISSTIIAFLPLLVGLAIWILRFRKGFSEETGLTNLDLDHALERTKPKGESREEEKAGILSEYKPLTTSRLAIILAFAMVAGIVLFNLSPRHKIESIPITIGREEASKRAISVLEKEGIDLENYQSVVSFETALPSIADQEYILKHSNIQKMREVFSKKLRSRYWSVRFFKPLEKREFKVEILPNGQIDQIVRVEDEKAPGAFLSSLEVQKIAENYLREKGYNPHDYTLIETKNEEKEKRRDYTLIFEEKENKIGEATFRLSLNIYGDQIASLNRYIQIPEAWMRQKITQTTLDFIVIIILVIFFLILTILSFMVFFRLLREKKINFKQAYKVGGVLTGLMLIGSVNNLPVFYNLYSTSIPLSTYLTGNLLTMVIGIIFNFFTISLLVAYLFALWKEEVGALAPASPEGQSSYKRDALIAGYSLPIIAAGGTALVTTILISQNWLKHLDLPSISGLNSFFPFLTVITGFSGILIGASFSAIGLLVLKRYLKRWDRIILVTFFTALLLSIPLQRTAQDFLLALLQNLLPFLYGIFAISFIARKNFFAYILVLVSGELVRNGWNLYQQPNPFLHFNGVLLLICAGIPLLFYFIEMKKRATITKIYAS